MGYPGEKAKIRSEGGENINIGHQLENKRGLFKERNAERSIVLFDHFQERINEVDKETMK